MEPGPKVLLVERRASLNELLISNSPTGLCVTPPDADNTAEASALGRDIDIMFYRHRPRAGIRMVPVARIARDLRRNHRSSRLGPPLASGDFRITCRVDNYCPATLR